jgi:hypothetical protein
LFLSCSVFFRCGANFLRSWAAKLEVAATQPLEFADEVFCAAEVPPLQGVLLYLPDRRNLHHQRYCSEPAYRKQSKAESQRDWVQKPDNQSDLTGFVRLKLYL